LREPAKRALRPPGSHAKWQLAWRFRLDDTKSTRPRDPCRIAGPVGIRYIGGAKLEGIAVIRVGRGNDARGHFEARSGRRNRTGRRRDNADFLLAARHLLGGRNGLAGLRDDDGAAAAMTAGVAVIAAVVAMEQAAEPSEETAAAAATIIAATVAAVATVIAATASRVAALTAMVVAGRLAASLLANRLAAGHGRARRRAGTASRLLAANWPARGLARLVASWAARGSVARLLARLLAAVVPMAPLVEPFPPAAPMVVATVTTRITTSGDDGRRCGRWCRACGGRLTSRPGRREHQQRSIHEDSSVFRAQGRGGSGW